MDGGEYDSQLLGQKAHGVIGCTGKMGQELRMPREGMPGFLEILLAERGGDHGRYLPAKTGRGALDNIACCRFSGFLGPGSRANIPLRDVDDAELRDIGFLFEGARGHTLEFERYVEVLRPGTKDVIAAEKDDTAVVPENVLPYGTQRYFRAYPGRVTCCNADEGDA